MAKTIKMVLYAEPGVGKSTFASHAENPFFITTDGNYEWLDLPEEDHKQVYSWEEAKAVFAKLNSAEYEKYNTIVIDLIEDLFKWTEYEYCKKNRINHMSDLGYGKAYDETRNEFYTEVSKVLALNKHVILLTHGLSKIEKDRRGVETTKYIPSNRIPDKVWDMIEGRVRYFLRAYTKGEETPEGKMVKRRYLSVIPKENEYGIARGLDEANCPEDISLNWDEFTTVVGLNKTEKEHTGNVSQHFKTEAKVSPMKTSVVDTPKTVETPKVEEKPVVETSNTRSAIDELKKKLQARAVTPTPAEVEPTVTVESTNEEVSVNVIETPTVVEAQPTTETKELTQAEKIAKIKAMFANRNKQ